MPEPSKADVLARAKQLFEEETGRPWEGTPDDSPGEVGIAAFVKRAEIELRDIIEEGHS